MNAKQLELERLALMWEATINLPDQQASIAQKITELRADSAFYSREYLFKVSEIDNHAITLNFIPTSPSHEANGRYVTLIRIQLNEADSEEIIRNMSNNPPLNTQGELIIEILKGPGQHESIVIHTRDILVVEHL